MDVFVEQLPDPFLLFRILAHERLPVRSLMSIMLAILLSYNEPTFLNWISMHCTGCRRGGNAPHDRQDSGTLSSR